MGTWLKNIFPNIELIGNYDIPTRFGHFDLYVRGVGFSPQRDSEGRVFLYQKQDANPDFFKKFKNKMLKMYDNLILLIAPYGDSVELEKAQEEYLKNTVQPKKWDKSHEFPVDVPPRNTQKEMAQKIIIKDTPMICRNWGCQMKYNYDENTMKDENCVYHPGRFEFGSFYVLMNNLELLKFSIGFLA